MMPTGSRRLAILGLATVCWVLVVNNTLAEEYQPTEEVVALRKAWLHAERNDNDIEARKFCEQYVELLKKQAQKGDIGSMLELGRLLTTGTQVYPRNLEHARKWFTKAAEAGDADAQYHLASMYQEGKGGIKDQTKADEWYVKAFQSMQIRAGKGDGNAAFWVGMMYFKGNGVKSDYQKALLWWKRSAELQSTLAPPMLARMYREGLGTEVDMIQSHAWFVKAAEQGNVDAMVEAALALKEGRGIPTNLKQARYWFSKAADAKHAYGLRELANMMKEGQGGPKNTDQALAYYIQSASYGDPVSAVEAARMLLNKEGGATDDDKKKARELLLVSADQFDAPMSQYALGEFDMEQGNRESAVHWIHEAAMNGWGPAIDRMGNLSLIPMSGVSWNPIAAWHWWKAADKAGVKGASAKAHWLLWGGSCSLLLAIGALLYWMKWKVDQKWKREEEEGTNGSHGVIS